VYDDEPWQAPGHPGTRLPAPPLVLLAQAAGPCLLGRRSDGGRLNRRSTFMESLFKLVTKFWRILVMVHRDRVLYGRVQQFLV
jgi:hypothetical protein